ncbi:MAG TPA: N-acetyltransferase [Candidatus Nealsonbacteria bacterium]|uniref:N-acetyltransferase domain-containing protein n=1 Tax=marine sediment metagenome TaxID=412755 RepID=A0A0F9XXD3_9ZZZZ|nr:N-acetyltransferase [Candidatus Nealsonbacteria bacterium]HEB46189.1 N-acetyltransferase [Candidatus Nealsonbacteria bacterium]
MPTIHSKQFILRPLRKGDEESLTKNINSKKIARNTLRIPYPYKKKDARFWINHNLKLQKKKKRTEINFAIDINGKIIGGIGLDKIEVHKAEIGYWLGEKYWGQGIMTFAVKLVTKYAFTKLGLKRVYADVFPFNKASVRVLEKAGYKYEGRLRKDVLKDNKLMDHLLFAKVK